MCNSSLNCEQKVAYNKYREDMTSTARVKAARVKSLFRDDGIFLNDDSLKEQVGNQLKTEKIESPVIQASVDNFIIKSIPDNKGFADVEVSFKPIVSYDNVGKYQLGGGAQLKKNTKTLPRQTLRLKVMNT
jgi:hypothetical protein